MNLGETSRGLNMEWISMMVSRQDTNEECSMAYLNKCKRVQLLVFNPMRKSPIPYPYSTKCN